MQRVDLTAGAWQPHFERALSEYVMEQKGRSTVVDSRHLLRYMTQVRQGDFPPIEPEEERAVGQLLNKYFRRIMPLWDGAVYMEGEGNKSVGQSIHVRTDDIKLLMETRLRIRKTARVG